MEDHLLSDDNPRLLRIFFDFRLRNKRAIEIGLGSKTESRGECRRWSAHIHIPAASSYQS